MAKCTVEFEYSRGDEVLDAAGSRLRVVGLRIDRYDVQFFYCRHKTIGEYWVAGKYLVPWTEQQGG